MSNEIIYVRNSQLLDTQLDAETVILSIEKGNYYGLNEVASRIWQLLEKPISAEQICAQLTKEFDVETSDCQKDIEGFIQLLLYHALILRKKT